MSRVTLLGSLVLETFVDGLKGVVCYALEMPILTVFKNIKNGDPGLVVNNSSLNFRGDWIHGIRVNQLLISVVVVHVVADPVELFSRVTDT